MKLIFPVIFIAISALAFAAHFVIRLFYLPGGEITRIVAFGAIGIALLLYGIKKAIEKPDEEDGQEGS